MTERSSFAWHAVLGALFRSFLVTGIPFVLVIVYLVLHRLGAVERSRHIAYERTLILALLVYWVAAALGLAVLRHRRAAGAWAKRQAPQIALFLVSTLVSLAFAEIALRMLRPETAERPFERLPSKALHHVNAPNRSSLGMGEKRVTTNADGFRTPYDRQSFLDYEHRVALLGDSYVFGLGVAAEDAVAAVLEEELGERTEGSVAVLNTGVISYSPFLERQAFRQVVREYRPTLTLLFVDMNDIGDDYQYAAENVSRDPDAPRFDVPDPGDGASWCELSALCRALGPVWQRLGKPFEVAGKLLGLHRRRYDYYDFSVEVRGKVENDRFFIVRYPLADTREYFEATWSHVEAAAHDVRAAGSDFALVVMPRFFHWNDEEAPENWEKDVYGVDEPYENAFLEFFDDKIETAPFPVVSLLPAFSAAEGPLVFRHDPHWNEAGHGVAGRALASWLVEAGWPGSVAAGRSVRSLPPAAPVADAEPGGEPGGDGTAGRNF